VGFGIPAAFDLISNNVRRLFLAWHQLINPGGTPNSTTALLTGGSPSKAEFNTTYFVGAAQWNCWMDPDYLNSMPSELREFARAR